MEYFDQLKTAAKLEFVFSFYLLFPIMLYHFLDMTYLGTPANSTTTSALVKLLRESSKAFGYNWTTSSSSLTP